MLDYYEHLDALDPPFITTNQTEDLPQNRLNQGWQILHHVRGHYALYDRCRGGGACAIKSRARNEGFEADLIAYLIEHLTAPQFGAGCGLEEQGRTEAKPAPTSQANKTKASMKGRGPKSLTLLKTVPIPKAVIAMVRIHLSKATS